MPLPEGGQWPPASTLAVADDLAVWAAWYSGKPAELERVHGGSGLGGQIADDPNAPGGWPREEWQPLSAAKSAVSAVVRRFWGTNTPDGEQSTKLHVPAAAGIAGMSAALLFAEPPTLVGGNDAASKRLQEYQDAGLWPSMREASEVCSGLGGVYLRVVWDEDVADMPWLTSVQPDGAVPEWRWDRLVAVTFWRVVHRDGKAVWRHLERHERGRILHGLFIGEHGKLGRSAPLQDHPDTAAFAEYLDADDYIETGTRLLTAEYVPNLKPNRVWTGIPSAANLGRADISGCEPLLDALDETYSDWMRDVRLAKGRLIVPQSALESKGKGKGARFDSDREVFTGLEMGLDDDTRITIAQFAIRAAEHEATARDFYRQIVHGAGYSPQTFGAAGEVAVTATEWAGRERMSAITRGQKVTYWTDALKRIIRAQMDIDRSRFHARLDDTPPTVMFPERVFVDDAAMAQAVKALSDARAASTETKVRMVHPRWTEEQVRAEVNAIDGQSATPDPQSPNDPDSPLE